MDATNQQNRAWSGRRVTLMGLGRHGGGLGAARYLARHGALVTISEQATAETLREPLAQLDGLMLEAIHCGGHDPRDFLDAECIVVNPAVRPDHECLRLVQKRGIPISSEIELFLARSPARVIGVTGSNGKSTTATMLRDILVAAGRRTWLGGNLGGSLLDQVDEIRAGDWVVLELSSFQLHYLAEEAAWPELAVITGCTPNHLDWHGSFADYAAAKRRLVAHSSRTVVHGDDAITSEWGKTARASTASWPPEEIESLGVPGLHNRRNAALAAAAAEAIGIERATILKALAQFRGLPHRIELVGEVAGRRFYDDSKATSPHATIAALAAISGPLWLLTGGVAKGVPFDELAQQIVRHARGAALFGAARFELAECLTRADATFEAELCESLDAALDSCWQRSCAGGAILLSPACASFDQFRDFTARGAAFRTGVRRVAAREEQVAAS